MRSLLHCIALLAAVGATCGLPGADLVWPTPNPAVAAGGTYADFVQPTESGLVESGMFGCVRTSRQQFHEGLDLKAVQRDKRGEATDPIFAMWAGTVRYASAQPGASNYGRYVILEHVDGDLNFISLYAHLLSIAPGTSPGVAVTAGQPLGVLGRSAGNSPIPRDRAHVHVETGFWLSTGFQRWYDAQKFGSANVHGVFNGKNLVGFDFLDYVERRRAREVAGVRDYVSRLPVAATVIVRSTGVPDFVARYPALASAPPPTGDIAAWQIDFTWFGLPKAWRALGPDDPEAKKVSGREIVFADAALLERFPCQKLVRWREGRAMFGPRLQETLDILFTLP